MGGNIDIGYVRLKSKDAHFFSVHSFRGKRMLSSEPELRLLRLLANVFYSVFLVSLWERQRNANLSAVMMKRRKDHLKPTKDSLSGTDAFRLQIQVLTE